jgi:hypothetical protein
MELESRTCALPYAQLDLGDDRGRSIAYVYRLGQPTELSKSTRLQIVPLVWLVRLVA